eukprot:TRINITY_DN74039_c0_g1_i1.p1 TRINITY_DN74039_c0_g1~~TRINITY_DN74039_c0_g1_i1.p1  ORF type:complete len:536 (-),score=101.55 TRINITY_DN74039_c0_g1_i1:216-1823(-)
MRPTVDAHEVGHEAGTSSGRRSEQGDAVSVPCHIFLPVVPAARVIGKGGANIRAIREHSGADVRILQKELPHEMQRREDRIVQIRGDVTSMREAIVAVLARVFDRSGLPGGVAFANDRANILEVVVPEKSGSHLIGHKGERVRSLIEETCCDINVVKEPMVGLADQKRVRITGNSEDAVAHAVWRVQDVLAELLAGGILKTEHFDLREANSVVGATARSSSRTRPAASGNKEAPIRLLVKGDEAAWVVGKRGNKIMTLRNFAKVHMNDADSPPFDSSERILEISAAVLEQRMRVVQLVVEDLALRQETTNELRLLVPTEHFGSVMGRRGENIRGIMQSTGAALRQHKAERTQDGGEYWLRLVEVKGSENQRVKAVEQIHAAFETKQDNHTVQSMVGSDPLSNASINFSGGLHNVRPQDDAGGKREARPVATLRSSSDVGVIREPLRDVKTVSRSGIGNALGAGERGDEMTLQLAMPSQEVATMLASDTSGIAWRAGVSLSVASGAGDIPLLQIRGTAVGNSVACYLVQDRLFMMH